MRPTGRVRRMRRQRADPTRSDTARLHSITRRLVRQVKGSHMDQLSDNVIEYQLSKVDQGGEVQELFEARMSELSAAWGYPIEANEDHPNFGDIRLPDGRYVTFTYGVEFMDAPDRDAPRGAPGCTCGTPPFSPPEPDPSCPFHGEAS